MMVELEIHAGSNLDVVEIRVLVSVRDDADLERVIAGIANCQAHAIDGDTALVDAKIAALRHFSIGGIFEGEAVATVFAHFVDTNGGVIYVPWTMCPSKRPFIIIERSTFTSLPSCNSPRLLRSSVSFIAVTTY